MKLYLIDCQLSNGCNFLDKSFIDTIFNCPYRETSVVMSAESKSE